MKIITNVLAIMLSSTAFTTYAQETILASSAQPPKSTSTASETTEVIKAEATLEEKEEEEATFTLSGSVDAYFHSSFKTRNANYDDAYAPSTSFADLRGFSLGMINMIASYSGEKAGFTADLVFGPRGRAAVFGTASGQAIVNQAFMFYKFSDKATLNLGQFNTFVGYEVISPAANFHYSTSYLFSWGPFNHTGARLDLAFDKGVVAKVAVMNPTDIVEFNPVNTYTLGAQVGKTGEALSVWLNFLYGDQDGTLEKDEAQPGDASAGSLFQGDITLTYSLSDKVSLGFNASLQQTASGEQVDLNGEIEDIDGPSSSFTGFALYPRISLTESFALGLRAEYFAVKSNHLDIFGLDENGDGNVMAFTLSGNYKTGGLTFIPEIRIDKTSEDSFYEGTSTKSVMPSLTLAAVYKF
jgi:hypothetical protein